MEHKVVVYRGIRLDLFRKWVCVCGTPMKATIMGPDLYREFEQHVKEKSNG